MSRLKVTKKRIMKDWTVDSTCGCGLHIHPENRLTNPKAIHIKDCPFHVSNRVYVIQGCDRILSKERK